MNSTLSDAAAAATFCANLVRARDFKSYAASLFVAPEPRRAWLALAAFNVEVAFVRDHVSQPLPGEIRLQWWRDVLIVDGKDSDRDGIEGNPVASELLLAIRRYDLPIETLVRLVDAHVFDVYDDPMPDMAALEAHCRDTSAALFALRARMLGVSIADVQRIADHAGLAEGLVDVMLSLPKHAARRQLYLPADLMNLKDANAEDVFLHRASSQLNDVLTHLRAEAHKQSEIATSMLRDGVPQVRAAFLPLVQVAKNLKQLEKANAFSPPPMSRLAVLWTMWLAARSAPFKV